MKILHISDTHGFHDKLKSLQEADILVHSGDFTFGGSEQETRCFLNWFCALPYKYKIFVAGNHDDCLYDGDLPKLPANVFYLRNSGVEIEGLKFWGVPLFMADVMNGSCDGFIRKIPDDTDVLITHQPPLGILDYAAGIHFGNQALTQKVLTIKPKCHLFGHDHNSPGILKQDGVVFSNAAIVDSKYVFNYLPQIIEL